VSVRPAQNFINLRLVLLEIKFATTSTRLPTGWTAQGLNSGGGAIFRYFPDGPCVPTSLMYNEFWSFFAGGKRPERGANHRPPPKAEFREKLELCFYSPCGSSWHVGGWALPLYLPQVPEQNRLATGWTVRGSNPGGMRFSAPVQTGP